MLTPSCVICSTSLASDSAYVCSVACSTELRARALMRGVSMGTAARQRRARLAVWAKNTMPVKRFDEPTPVRQTCMHKDDSGEIDCAIVFNLTWIVEIGQYLCTFHKRQYQTGTRAPNDSDLVCSNCGRRWEMRLTRHGKLPSGVLGRTRMEFTRHIETCVTRSALEARQV